MTQLTNLDTTDLTDWLTRVTQTIDRSLRDPVRTEAAAALRAGLHETKVSLHVLTQLALLEDCLRVAHLALEADGIIEDVELTRITDLVGIAAPRFFAVLPHYEAFGDGATTPAEVVQFLRLHRADTGPFGFASSDHWRGLHLARRVEQHTRNASPLREHERMLARVMDEVFSGRASEVERSARRRLRDLFEPTPTSGLDPRAVAFCRPDGPEVFASIAHGSQIHDRDAFDVESIHADARDIFHRQVERATTPEQHSRGFGRTLLLLGDSGAGKTHLLRALRTQTHSGRRGYVGYMQMTSEVGDYGRYVLRNLIDSLERPYDPPALSESGLMYLSNAVAEGRADIPRDALEMLRAAELSPDQLDSVIGTMIDHVVRTDGLAHLETDLLHALFLLQRRDPALQRRVVKFLRCESLGGHDRKMLGGLTPRDQPEDPLRTIRQLGTIMYELSDAALVVLVDQIEDTIPDGQTATRIQQAFDNLRAVSDSVPSAVVVIACLTDVYDAIKPKLSKSVVDRLELDPAPVRLASLRETPEIEQMLVKRLENLYSAFDVPWRDDEPYYPFTSQQIEAVNRLRARDCLAKFREFHTACIAAHAIVAAPGTATTLPELRFPVLVPPPRPLPVEPAQHATPLPLPPLPPPPPPEPRLNAQLERAWNDALVAAADLPDAEDDAGILALIDEGLRAAAYEHGTPITVARESKQLVITGDRLSRRIVEMCNRGAQGGRLGTQLEALRKRATGDTIPFAIRSSDWKFRPKTRISEQVGELLAAGGRIVVVEEHDLRAIVAARVLATANPPGFADWWRASKKLAALRFIRELLDLDRVPAAPPAPAPAPAPLQLVSPPSRPTPVPTMPPPLRVSAPHVAFDPDRIRLGTTTTMRAEPIYLPLEQVKTHVAFLGTTGSGKTTAATRAAAQRP
ncbi:MAG: ATP-binding protein, partial [Deltaproteobacteria bacterium]|nr:ATP-binding protein [Deltaproteobacteria bacterium]